MTGLEKTIIERIKEGDQEAFAVLYHQYADYALRVGFAVTKDRANGADASRKPLYESIETSTNSMRTNPLNHGFIKF